VKVKIVNLIGAVRTLMRSEWIACLKFVLEERLFWSEVCATDPGGVCQLHSCIQSVFLSDVMFDL
jgi:hypothetical protein